MDAKYEMIINCKTSKTLHGMPDTKTTQRQNGHIEI